MIIDQGSISDGINCCHASPSGSWHAFEPTKILQQLPATIDLFQPVLMLVHGTKVDLGEDVLCLVVREDETSAAGDFCLGRFVLRHILGWGIRVVSVKKYHKPKATPCSTKLSLLFCDVVAGIGWSSQSIVCDRRNADQAVPAFMGQSKWTFLRQLACICVKQRPYGEDWPGNYESSQILHFLKAYVARK